MSTDMTPGVIAAKRWSVSAASLASEPLKLFCAGQPLTSSAPATLDGVSPVEHFLISVAGCFALSCRAAFAAKKLPLAAFDVNVTGTKALDLPSRLESIAISVAFGADVSAHTADTIITGAKRLCTLTNTLQAAPVSVSVAKSCAA